MRKYYTAFIKQYIEEHKDEVESIDCGMMEDWFYTAETIFSGGQFNPSYSWDSTSINVAGITGSTWATPVMQVLFKDGRIEIVNCFFDDGGIASLQQIAEQMDFAFMTGGKPII